MGIVNVTPDSFSDGGDFLDSDNAIRHAIDLVAAGADIVDVGGESTRPGSEGVSVDEELARVLPVIEGLQGAGATISIDTSKPEVAAAATRAGADIINDVTALAADGMPEVAVEAGAAVVLMHKRGEPRTMQEAPVYDDVVAEVSQFLMQRAAVVRNQGVAAESIAIDPGIGFGKTLDHNLALMANLERFVASSYPVLLGTSRKAFIGQLLDGAPPSNRDVGTAATLVAGILAGVAVVRVHNVAVCRQAVRITDAIVGSES